MMRHPIHPTIPAIAGLGGARGQGPAYAYASETAAAVTLTRDPAGPVRLRIRARAVRLTCDPGIVLAETAHSITLDL